MSRKRRRRPGALARASLLSLAVLPSLVPAARAEEGALSLESAVEAALEQYPSLAVAGARLSGASARLAEARASLRPDLSLQASATRFEEPMVVTPIHGFDLTQLPAFDETLVQAVAEIGYTLYDGGGRQASIRGRRSRSGAAEAGVAAERQVVVARTITAYLRVLGLGETLAAHDRRRAALAAEHERVEQRLAVGRAAEVEKLRVEAAQAAAEAERVHLATGLETAERELARLIGSDPAQVRADHLIAVRLRDPSLPSRAELEQEAMRASPRLQQAREAVAGAEAALATARSGRAPRLRLRGRLLDFGSAAGDNTTEWSAGMELALPLYTGGATRERVAGAQAGLEESNQALRQALLDLGQALDTALAGVEESRSRLASLETAVASYREVARIEALRLEVGSGTQTDYLSAEADLLTASADLVQARYREILARAELAATGGALGSEWVHRSLETVR